ncbi:protein SUPPRESSOR OF GENE SILENCING 3 homolog [Abrus precatorius]|uniref:Protein SUPPRESSOR OF GENE SILENCING 3 homolog n=1 Tax=Abrus precatorius TaxID=3816 RepID=A0A8B8M7F7_ABRPR|nr:protein SUPPRESSOR OF GENE SILENCING 3 homolog [Abrus precatorius]
MAGGNHPKSSHHKPPPSASHRKSRWEPNTSTTTKSPSDPKLSPKIKPNPNPNPSPAHPKHPTDHPLFPFPDPAPLGPPPPPAYGFHMLERRTIVLADGSVRSYFALPPDYQDFTPPPPRFRLPDYHRNPPEASAAKRKYGGDDDDLARQRDQLLRNANGLARVPGADLFAGPSGALKRDLESEFRPSKHLRFDARHPQVDQDKLKKAFLHFAKLVNENASQKKSYLEDGKQGRLQCVACACGSGRSAKDFPDMHALIMHTYNSDNADLRVDHLGLHKALCVLMGWNYSKPPDNSKAYQFLSADEAAANQDDLIMWPPLVIIHNTNTGKNRDGRMEGLGNKTMDNKIRELGFMGGKSKSLYGRDGHLGVTLVKFAGDPSGFKEAIRLAEHFEKENHGRKDWAHVQSQTLGKDDENNANLVKVDEKKGEKRRVLYGYLGTAFDLDKVDFETRKKAVLESKREYKPPL